ncbi:HAD-IIB family hydrolase [Candidatus Saccharibacteria bacterium]|nr:HAD-IIB family hydrolase [Candidatus Saccharibacteria bacterium]
MDFKNVGQMKRAIIFDLDGTLTPSKALMTSEMAAVFAQALDQFEVCVISGGSFKRFEKQLFASLPEEVRLSKLTIMPTCGTQRYEYDDATGSWHLAYIDELSGHQRQQIVAALEEGIAHFGYDKLEAHGERIEDRGSQITYSALGQDIADVQGAEGLRRKAAWDMDNSKKEQLREYVQRRLPDFEVRISSPTSIDVSKPGMDKAYGVNEFLRIRSLAPEAVVFFGDRLMPGGNDYPVKRLGVDCIPVENWQEAASILKQILDA